MKLVVLVKLTTSPEVAAALRSTLSVRDEQANRVSVLAHRTGAQSRKTLQAEAYHELKNAGLSAQPALHVIRKVADSYATLSANIRAHGSCVLTV